MNQIATIAPSRLPLAPAVAREYELSPGHWRVLVEQTFPSAKSAESVLMALAYCKARNLDVFKKPVHIVPMWSSEKKAMVETVWPGISEIRTTAARTGAYAGIDEIEFGQMVERKFGDFTVRFPEYAKATVYRIVKGHRSAFTATVWWEEAYASEKGGAPNSMWRKRPRGQLAKCAEAAAIRMAFPEEVGNDLTAEEMEGQIIDHAPREIAPALSAPPPPPPPPPVAGNPVTDKPEQTDIGNPISPALEDAKAMLDEIEDADELHAAWSNIDLDALGEGEADELQAHYYARLDRLDPNTMRAG